MRLRARYIVTGAAACSAALSSAFAQELSQLEPPQATALLDPSRADSLLLFGPADPESSFNFLRWGPVVAHPHIDATFAYSSRMRSKTGAAVNTVSETISPGVLLALGSRWTLDYTPSLTYYSHPDLSDRLNHRVSLQGAANYRNWGFGLSQTYATSSSSLLETGRQTDTETFTTGLSASHYFSSQWMLQLTATQNFRDADDFNSSRSWSTMEWLNYQLSQHLSAGVGAGGGFESVSAGSDMAFGQLQAQVNARVSQKVNLNIHGGGEFREVLDYDVNMLNPIYGVAIQYRPFEQTLLSLSGNRTIQASLIQNQITESTVISLGLRQRLLGALSLSLSGGFANTRYIVSSRDLSFAREDDGVQFHASLGYGFLRRGHVSIFYTQTENMSSTDGFDSSARQVGLNLGYRF